jgi:signal transduction histidine kinase
VKALADPKILRIIFQNLLSNAVKYTPDGGRLTISIKKTEEKIKIEVANNGVVIPKEEQAKIFDKLFRASNAQEMDPDGNGLGLYLLKSIVETGGGKVWFESEAGRDTVFFVEFPMPGMKEKKGEKALS